MNKLNQLLVWISVKLIHVYRLLLSPIIGNQCRFYPSCSRYAEESLLTHGFFRGTYLSVIRLLKCHPGHPGGEDLVPPTNNQCCSHSHSHHHGSH
jgi:putative membrane protein insertion efficiency factor